ncbi:MAG: zinc ABC transporter substrate-binding protein [Chloroflexota bacterium]
MHAQKQRANKPFVSIVITLILMMVLAACGAGNDTAATGEDTPEQAADAETTDTTTNTDEGDDHAEGEEHSDEGDDHAEGEEHSDEGDDRAEGEEHSDEAGHSEGEEHSDEAGHAEGEEHSDEAGHSEGEEHDHSEGEEHDHSDEMALGSLENLTAIEDGQTANVVATTNIVGDIVQQVAGDSINLTVLIPAGGDPHSFEPTPQDVATVAEADLVLVNGLGLEEFLTPLIENSGVDTNQVLSVSDGVATIAFEGEHSHDHGDEGHDEHGDEGHDEHSDDHGDEGHDEHGDQHSEGKLDAEHACFHMADGPEQAITATNETTGSATAGEGTHVRLDVTLTEAETGFGGYFTYTAEEDAEYVFFADSPVTVNLIDADGAEQSSEMMVEESDLAGCEEIVEAAVFDLSAGEHVLNIVGAESDAVRLVVEEVGHSHDHGDEEHSDEAGHGHSHGSEDPHVWFSPENVMVWTENLAAALGTVDPANAETYTTNAESYMAELEELDAEIKEQIDQIPEENRELVTDHDALGYYADRYGFELIGAVIPSYSTLAEPSAQERAELEEAIATFDVPAIFVGTTVNPDLSEQVAQDTGIELVAIYTGSLSEEGGPAGTYLEMMRYNTQAIVDGLMP